jgi:2-(1,2-epoxy-1,2-dihydrophenyl)acetyl-CoA isomerase
MDAVSKPVLVERHGAAALITLNQPERMNVFDDALGRALADALSDVTRDAELRAIGIVGEGRSFMAGGDVSAFRQAGQEAPEYVGRLIDLIHPIIQTIRELHIPVVAGVQGPVAGGGFSLAMACDLVIAAEETKFVPAYGKLATSCDAGLSWTLTRLVGTRRALEILWFGEAIDAEQAAALGLVNKVVPLPKLKEETLSMLERLSGLSGQAVSAMKGLVNQAVLQPLGPQLDAERASFVKLAATAEFQDAVQRFFAARGSRG